MPLDVREWTCPHSNTYHDRDANAAQNIRTEGIRIIKAEGSAVSAVGGEVSPNLGRKSKFRHSPVITEALVQPKATRSSSQSLSPVPLWSGSIQNPKSIDE